MEAVPSVELNRLTRTEDDKRQWLYLKSIADGTELVCALDMVRSVSHRTSVENRLVGSVNTGASSNRSVQRMDFISGVYALGRDIR